MMTTYKSKILLCLLSLQSSSNIVNRCNAAPYVAKVNEAQSEESDKQARTKRVGESTVDAQSPKIKIRGSAKLDDKYNDGEPHVPLDYNDNDDLSSIRSFFLDDTHDDIISSNLKREINILSNTPSLTSFLTDTRRRLHKHPELMYEESYTSQTIRTILTELDIPHTTGWAKNTHMDVYKGPGGYGVVADIGTGGDPCIILRADMDALPIEEKTPSVDGYKSNNKGKMHACGHDGHTTMLLGAAVLLKRMEGEIQGTVRLMFQPAEEGGAGAKRMVEEGVVDMEPKAQLAFGMHVWPMLPSGTIASAPGPLLAAAEQFEILLSGKGGHAAMPHLAIDPIVAASSIVMNLQTIISRILSPLESGVVSVTQLTSGDAFNVIPASAVMKGTIRALSTEGLMELRDKVAQIVNTTAIVHNCNTTITFSPDFYPPTVNDPELFHDFSKHVGALVSKEGLLRDVEPTMGGEDFSFLTERIPSTFFLLGQGGGEDKGSDGHHVHREDGPATDYSLHHPSFGLDEEVLPMGVELHLNLALRALKRLRGGGVGSLDETSEEL